MTAPAHVFVIDDNYRFALRVYRVLARAFEFGIVPQDKRRFLDGQVSPDGRFELTWHDPSAPGADLKSLVKRLKAVRAKAWVILDLRFDTANPTRRNGFETYYAKLKKAVLADRLWLMSSYRYADGKNGASLPEIRSKSLETLFELRTSIHGTRAAAKSFTREPHSAHVLVTGAGFELSDPRALSAIGMPATSALIRQVKPAASDDPAAQASERFAWAEEPESSSQQDAWSPFPKLADDAMQAAKQLRGALLKAIVDSNLDEYWDVLLAMAHRVHLEELDRSVSGDPTYARRSLDLELRLREAFRSSIAKYDIGHMAQHVAAARLPWDFWLTTNYTRFIDRALTVSGNPWQLLQTPVEANVFQSSALVRDETRALPQLAIKLHGDTSQVYTMAIAGQDKAITSPLYVRPALHTMYVTAADAICTGLLRRKVRTCQWHIVGHGLGDASLVDLIKKAVERTPGVDHRFRMVAPKGLGKVQSRLNKAVKSAKIDPRAATSAAYLERLSSAWPG